MSTNHTPNYALNQWVKSDRVLMEDFNADNVKIDGALKALSSGLAGKASAAALSSLQTEVGKKQDSAGAVRIASGSYAGRDGYGKGYETSLSFAATLGKLPELLVVRAENGVGNGLILLKNMKSTMMSMSGSAGSGGHVTVTWNAATKTVSWYASNSEAQFNLAGTKYLYFAIG